MSTRTRVPDMHFEDEWSANEDCLVQEADSLGALLTRMRSVFSTQLVGVQEWEKLTACARDLPPTLAGFPLWIGFPIDDSRPAVYLDVSLLGATRSATAVGESARCTDVQPLTAAASLLEMTAREDAPVRQVAGDRVLLHYDIDAAGIEDLAHRAPVEASVLLYPIRATLAGEESGAYLQNFNVVLDALAAATGRTPDVAERRQLEQVYLALEPGTRIGAVSASPSPGSAFRVTVLGLSGTASAMAFLDRVRWRGESSAATRSVARLEASGALAGMHLGLQFDVTATGVEQVLELQVFSANTIHDDTGWFKDKDCWSTLIDGLREEGLASSQKLPELEKWSFAAKPLFGKSGPLLLMQRIHHFAILPGADGVHRLNAHVFFLLTRWSRGTGTAS